MKGPWDDAKIFWRHLLKPNALSKAARGLVFHKALSSMRSEPASSAYGATKKMIIMIITKRKMILLNENSKYTQEPLATNDNN